MKFQKIHNKGQARLFKNKYLEWLTKTHPLVIWSLYLPLVTVMLYLGFVAKKLSFMQVSIAFACGIFCWTLFEYLMHRFVFHFLAETDKGRKIIYIIHGNHHEYPRDKERLFMPPVPSLVLAAAIFLGMNGIHGLLGIQAYSVVVFAGFLVGYLIYGSMHYAIHAWNPPFKWMKPLWRNHHLHHYKAQEKGFGVSSTLWDHVFGTMFDLKNEKEDRQKEQELKFVKKAVPWHSNS